MKVGPGVSDQQSVCSAFQPWPNFMALLSVSTESALTEAGNSVLTASVFHGLAANFGFCACVFYAYKASVEIRRLHVRTLWTHSLDGYSITQQP